jgi:hypothetical protein
MYLSLFVTLDVHFFLQELDLYDIQTIDPELGRTLLEMQVLVRRKQFMENTKGLQRESIDALQFKGTKIEDLCLDFTLPGYPEYELKTDGREIMVWMPHSHSKSGLTFVLVFVLVFIIPLFPKCLCTSGLTSELLFLGRVRQS